MPDPTMGQSTSPPESVSMFVCGVCGRANDIDLYDGEMSYNRCRFTGCPSHADPESKPLKSVTYVLPPSSSVGAEGQDRGRA